MCLLVWLLPMLYVFISQNDNGPLRNWKVMESIDSIIWVLKDWHSWPTLLTKLLEYNTDSQWTATHDVRLPYLKQDPPPANRLFDSDHHLILTTKQARTRSQISSYILFGTDRQKRFFHSVIFSVFVELAVSLQMYGTCSSISSIKGIVRIGWSRGY